MATVGIINVLNRVGKKQPQNRKTELCLPCLAFIKHRFELTSSFDSYLPNMVGMHNKYGPIMGNLYDVLFQ